MQNAMQLSNSDAIAIAEEIAKVKDELIELKKQQESNIAVQNTHRENNGIEFSQVNNESESSDSNAISLKKEKAEKNKKTKKQKTNIILEES